MSRIGCLARVARRSTLISLTVLAYAAFVAIKLAGADEDASIFVVTGDRHVYRGRLDVPLAAEPHSNGIDGQFAYRIAPDPFTTRLTGHGIALDTPGLRGPVRPAGRPWTAGLVACAAVLTRETSLPYLFGFGAVTAWRAIAARRPDRPIVAFLLPVLTPPLWKAVLVAYIWREPFGYLRIGIDLHGRLPRHPGLAGQPTPDAPPEACRAAVAL